MKMVKRSFQKLKDMTYYWKDEKHKCYEALVQEWEILTHMGDKILNMRKDLDNLHGRTIELDELEERI